MAVALHLAHQQLPEQAPVHGQTLRLQECVLDNLAVSYYQRRNELHEQRSVQLFMSVITKAQPAELHSFGQHAADKESIRGECGAQSGRFGAGARQMPETLLMLPAGTARKQRRLY